MVERNRTYYQQHPCGEGPGMRPPTLTVGELIDKLQGLDRSLPVIVRSPSMGAFGAGMAYAIGEAVRETLPSEEVVEPEREGFDEEDGSTYTIAEDRYTLPAWDGVVLL